MMRKYGNFFILIIIIMDLVLSGCTALNNSLTDQNVIAEIGNTNGNIKQMGYAVERNGWIYYSDPTGNGKSELKGCLFKKRIDGSQKQNLVNHVAYQINVVGEYIYYVNGDPGAIYRINQNGGVPQKLEGRQSKNLLVMGNTVFYIRGKTLYQMDLNGNHKTRLVDDVLEFSIWDEYIFFTNQGDECLYKATLEGKCIQKLSDDYAKNINVADGWVYYWEFHDSKLYKLKDDGSEKIIISNDVCRNVNLYEGALYYRNQATRSSICKINTDGTEKMKIVDGNIVNINIINDVIIYYKVTEGEGYYQVNIDGSNQKLWQ